MVLVDQGIDDNIDPSVVFTKEELDKIFDPNILARLKDFKDRDMTIRKCYE